MDQHGLMSTVPRELRELYYDVVVCPDLESTGQINRASPSTLDTTSSSIYQAELRIPKVLGPLMTYEEQRIATGDAPVDSFMPMISLGDKKELDLTRETHVLVDCHMSIRVLLLRPANSLLDDVECELRVVRLRDGPVYEALSCTWGDESHRRYITVNDQRFSITSNLWAALRYLRRALETKCLWVDATCINQRNSTEKDYMVSQMLVIYHNSKRVIAWLGDPTLKSEQAFRFLAKYMSEGPQMGENQEGLQAVVENSKPMRNVDLSTWDAFLDIFGRPWWGRAWIVQEASCSRAGWTLMCGSSELSGNHLSCILPHFFDALEKSEVPSEAKTILDSGPFGVLSMRIRVPNQLGVVLAANRRREAKEDKDKVYAFANMIAPTITELGPNYEESTAEVYYQTAVQLIVKGNDLKVLSIYSSLIYLPGFQIGHMIGPQKSYGGGYIIEGVAYPFEAAGWKGPEVEFHGTSLVDSKGLLTIRANIIATIDQIGQDYYGGSVSDAIQGAFRLVSNAPIIVPAGQNGADGVLRSFTLDRDAEGERTYDEIAKEPPEIRRSAHRACVGRRFFRTKEGFVGLGPRRPKANDLVTLVPGCHVPITLCQSVYVEDRTNMKCNSHTEVEVCLGLGCAKDRVVVALRYEVIGETYLHGVMNGELNSILESGLQEFVLGGTEEKPKR